MEKTHPPPVWYGNDVTRWSRDVWGDDRGKKNREGSPAGWHARARGESAAAAAGQRGIGGGGGGGGWEKVREKKIGSGSMTWLCFFVFVE